MYVDSVWHVRRYIENICNRQNSAVVSILICEQRFYVPYMPTRYETIHFMQPFVYRRNFG